jgi:histidyl-tRNA synthetase
MTIETVKGFRDILPPNSLKRKKIKEIIEKNMNLFGFFPIETPTIEYEELLKGDNENDEAVSDRFRLKDRGERELGLRFEFTFQLSRLFKENPNIKLPFRRYQIGSVFRDEALRPGKFREFTQCDADIIGDSSIKSDAECIALGYKILNDLKIKAEIKVNNRKLLNSILEKLEIKKNQQQILRELDKLDKLEEKEVKTNLKEYLEEIKIKKLFDLLKKDLDYFIKNEFLGAEEIKELENFGKLYGYKFIFSPTLMRGFSYYTGNVWEIWAKDKGVALAGGGRYDNKVGKFVNRELPAVGISFGTLIDWDIELDEKRFLIISLDQDKKSIELSEKIRSLNI